MKVLTLPDYSMQNPYQWLLARALHERGVETTNSDGLGRWPVLGAVAAYGMPDVVHLHWPDQLVQRRGAIASTVAAMRLAGELLVLRRRGVRLVWTAHNLRAHDSRHPVADRLAAALVSRAVHAVIVHTTDGRDQLARFGGLGRRLRRRISVVPHGHYRDVYPATMDRSEARESLGLTAKHTVFLMFGQLRAYRGIDELLDAFSALASPDARLLVVGSPADTRLAQRVESAAASDPRLLIRLGHCPDEEVQRYFLAADAVALPYRAVQTSGVAVLAASFNRACIAPRVGDLPDVLPAHAWVRYDASAPSGLRHALSEVVATKDTVDAEAGVAADGNPSWADIAEQTLSLYAPGRNPPSVHGSEPFPDPWRQRVDRARAEVAGVVPRDDTLVVVDEGALLGAFDLHRCTVAFPARDGVPWGPPATDAEAVAELTRLHSSGARWLVIPWSSFW